jgi:hypothetical protein
VLSATPESQHARVELAEARRQYLIALKAFTSYVSSSLPFTTLEPGMHGSL